MFRPICLALLFSGVSLADVRPVSADDLVIGVQDLRPGLDPAIELSNAGFPLSNAIFETLIRRDFAENGQGTSASLKPGLAEAWRRIDDRTVELTLRAGLTFHNGEELASDDVAFTFMRILDPDSNYGSARFQLGNIESVEAVDPLTVRVVTKTPDPLIEQLLAYPGSAIVPKDYFEEVGFDVFGQNPIGAGPYRFVEMSNDDRVDLAAFVDYWEGTPPATTLVFREIPEVSARITALANGEVGIINSLPPDQVSAIERLTCCDLRSVLVNSHVLNYRTDNPAMADRRFRQGLNLAIDRDLLVEALWNGQAEVPRSHQYEEWANLYNAERPRLQFDPTRARNLIAASGYDGQTVEFVTHPVYYTNGLAAAEAIVSMWQDVGVNAEVQVNENWYAASNENVEIEVRNLSDWLIVPDPHASILWSWTVTGLWKDNAEFQALGEQARATLDVQERYEIYQGMLDLFEEEAPGTVLYRAREFYGVRSDLTWLPYSVYMMDFRPGNLAFAGGSAGD